MTLSMQISGILFRDSSWMPHQISVNVNNHGSVSRINIAPMSNLSQMESPLCSDSASNLFTITANSSSSATTFLELAFQHRSKVLQQCLLFLLIFFQRNQR